MYLPYRYSLHFYLQIFNYPNVWITCLILTGIISGITYLAYRDDQH